MEVVLPIVALGGLYVISNQNKNKKSQDGFNNMKQNNNLNVNSIPQNYPVDNINQLKNNMNQYNTINNSTSDYLNQTNYQNNVNNNISVSNNPKQMYNVNLENKDFNHTNMVPFNGSKPRGNIYNYATNESILDNMNGSGSQQIKKVEQAPLFKPEDNMQYSYGTPNNSDFYQSRVNNSMKNNNVKPFESVLVGPGLNKGYDIKGNNGFNSGMESREKWMPLNVDELRVETNPKMVYELNNLEGPAISNIKNVPTQDIIGNVEKYLPDRHYENTSDRWLNTTGYIKGETQRSAQEMGIIKRCNNLTDYKGAAIASDKKAMYSVQNYQESKRYALNTNQLNGPVSQGKGNIENNNLREKTNYVNNRSTMKQQELFGGFSGTIGAVIAPLMDILKPTLKEESIDNIRIYGEAKSAIPGNYIINTNDTPNTTIKETTLYSQGFNINNQKEGMYINNQGELDLTQRETTSSDYNGIAGGNGSTYGNKLYDNAYRQHNNDIKSSTIDNRINQGGTQMFNQYMNVNCSKNDTTRYDYRVNGPSLKTSAVPSMSQYGKVNYPQQYDETAGTERINPDLLNSFRKNPYTHSLSSAV